MLKGTTGGASKRHRRGRQRGVGLVEYALAGSFVLVTCSLALGALEQESEAALQSRGTSIGSPDADVPAGDTTTTTEEPSPDTTGTTATTAPPLPPDAAISSQEASVQGNKWTATVVVTITVMEDGVPEPVHKASVTATWVRQPGGSTVEVQCSTLPNGTCTFTLKDMPTNGNSDHVAAVDFTVTGVTPDGGTTSTPPLSATISEPA